MAKQVSAEIAKARAEAVEAIDAFVKLFDGLEAECAVLEAKKATLTAEVGHIQNGLTPLQQERDGQRKEVSRAYEEARLAKVEGDKQKAAMQAELNKLETQVVAAKKKAEDAYAQHIGERAKEMDAIDRKLADKKKAYEDFLKKINKDA